MVITTTTGVDEADLSIFRVYPNPTRDLLHVDLPTGEATLLEIIDMQGRLVRQVQVNGDRAVLHVGDLATGTYMLRLQGAEAVRTTRFQVAGGQR